MSVEAVTSGWLQFNGSCSQFVTGKDTLFVPAGQYHIHSVECLSAMILGKRKALDDIQAEREAKAAAEAAAKATAEAEAAAAEGGGDGGGTP